MADIFQGECNMAIEQKVAVDRAGTDRKPAAPATAPLKDPNPPDAEIDRPAPEVPKIGSRDAPGG
jgi:hypothetical protein